MAGGDNKNIWVIANWKSNKTIAEALDWVSKVGPEIPKRDNLPAGRQGLKVVVCPTFSCLSEIKKVVTVGSFPLMVGAQDLSPFGIGAYTGEEPAGLLNQFIELAIVGHSERKYNFGENDEMVAKKVNQALENKIIPLVCVQDENTPVPSGCSMIAYEPAWAISTGLTNTPGSGKVDTPENARRMAASFKQKYGENLEVIYGGSVTAANVKGFIEADGICGVLVGNASLNADEFIKIIKEAVV